MWASLFDPARIVRMFGSMTEPLRVGENEIVFGCAKQGPHFRITVTGMAG
jgi:hypothetical protein